MKKSNCFVVIPLLLFGQMKAQSGDMSMEVATEQVPKTEIANAAATEVQPLFDSSYIMSNPSKRIPSRGINIGISQHEIYLTSLNIGYLSGEKWGVDFSARTLVFAPIGATFFVGPVYQINDSRLFAKAGVELIYVPYWGDYGDNTVVILGYLGGKSLIPFSNRIGLQLDFGVYGGANNKKIGVLPAFGLGFIICPFEQA